MSSNASRLEDFGARGIASPADRLKEYQSQSKGLPKKLQAKFWLEVLDRDTEVKRIIENKDGKKDGRRN